MVKRINHNATKKQEKAFENVVKAMNKAKAVGLHFYAKQFNLIAYTEQADNYLNRYDFQKYFGYGTSKNTVPYLSAHSILDDSGADDYQYYLTDKDFKNHNPM